MRLRRFLPVILSGIIGTLVIVGFYQPNLVSTALLEIAQIVTAGGVLLGVGNLLTIHLKAVRAGKERLNRLALITALVASFAIQLSADLLGGDLRVIAGEIFRYIYQPLAGSLIGLLTFFALRASWQAMQVRPAEASVILVVAALFLLVGGPWAAAVPGLSATLDWLRTYPVVGVTRGLLLGIGLGAMLASIRVLLGFDQPYFDQ